LFLKAIVFVFLRCRPHELTRNGGLVVTFRDDDAGSECRKSTAKEDWLVPLSRYAAIACRPEGFFISETRGLPGYQGASGGLCLPRACLEVAKESKLLKCCSRLPTNVVDGLEAIEK
jgi:hypothetical protein